MWNELKIKEIIDANKIVVFAKGTREVPQCGFSARVIEILGRCGKPFTVVNIFEDPEIRPSLIAFSNWPTTPQVFIDGELLGGSDIVQELADSGELGKKLEAAFA